MQYKNIIFDLGAVLFNIDYRHTTDAFVRLGLENVNDVFSKQKQQLFFDKFERGEISTEEFRSEVLRFLPSEIRAAEIDAAWNAMLIGIPRNRYSWLEKVRNSYNIYLLSNTNDIHLGAVKNMIEKDFGFERFEQLFIKTYYSCDVKMRKPEARIFELVIRENNLSKAETLFIDDSPQHIEGALATGLPALHLTDDMTVESLLEKVKSEAI